MLKSGRYVYSGYRVGFDLRSEISLPDGNIGIKCHYFWS